MASFTVVYDACLLYPASIRDLVVELGRTGCCVRNGRSASTANGSALSCAKDRNSFVHGSSAWQSS